MSTQKSPNLAIEGLESLTDYLNELDRSVSLAPTNQEWKDAVEFERQLISVAVEIPIKDKETQKKIISDSKTHLANVLI